MDWSYCKICRRNHEEGRKHIFSTYHKDKFSTVLSNFTKKVRSARRCLSHPNVLEGELEPGRTGKMWCYCCEKEIEKHIKNDKVSIEWGGLLEHMTEPEHHKKTRRFWWENGAETNKLQVFLLFPAEYRHFKELVIKALGSLDEREKERLEQLAVNLRAERDRVNLEPPEAGVPSLHQKRKKKRVVSWSSDVARKSSGLGHPGISQNLTSHSPRQIPGVSGNVHTGATPPWLREDSCDDSKDLLIGPSLDDFILHREKKKRVGRNPNRVGADFHIKLATQKQPDSEDWLPVFGRVWNHGPRLHSKEEFIQELNAKQEPPPPPLPPNSSSTSMISPSFPGDKYSGTSSRPTISSIQPYIRKKGRPPVILQDEVKSHDQLDMIGIESHDTPGSSGMSIQRDGVGSGLDIPSRLDLEVTIKPYVRKRKLTL